MIVYLELCVYLGLFLTSYGSVVKSKRNTFHIGGIFDIKQPEHQAAYLVAVNQIKKNSPDPAPFTLRAHSVWHDNKDVLSVAKETCKLFVKGVRVVIGPNSNLMSEHVGSVCSSKDITHIETRHYAAEEEHDFFKINLHPHPPVVGEMFLNILAWLEWGRFTIIYENDESLSKVHELLTYKSNEHDIKLKQLVLDDKNTYRLMLNATKNTGEKHFVVVCSLETLKVFLQQAQQVGMLSERHRFVIYNFDMHNIDLEPYQYGGCRIYTVRFVDPTNQKVQRAVELLEAKLHPFDDDLHYHKNQYTLNLETALIMDAVQLIHRNLQEYTRNNYVTDQRLNCNNSAPWWEGTSFVNGMNFLLRHGVEGHTGLMLFGSGGYRSNFKAEVLELKTTGLERIGVWNSTFIPDPSPPAKEPIGEIELKGGHFNVIAVLTQPYGVLKKTAKQNHGNDRYEGYGIDLIQKLSEMLGFTYTIYIQDNQLNGNYDNATQKWNGMMGRIMYDDVKPRMHFAIGDLTVTSERQDAVDFTHPFMTLGISILYKKPEPAPPSLFMFTSPFAPQVWLLLGVAYVFVSVSLFVLGRLSPSEWQNPYPCIEEPDFLINQFTFKNAFWFTIGSLMQQGTELAPVGTSTRTLAGVWWFFTLIMVSSYTANLAAFLTVTTLQTPFDNIHQLAKQTEIKYGAKQDGATESFFKKERKEYRTVWEYMKNNSDVRMKSNDDGVQKAINENYAFLMESTSIEYTIERECKLGQVGERLDEKGYAIAMRKNSTYRAQFNTALLKLQENGYLNTLKLKWWKEKLGGGNCQAESSTAKVEALDLKNVGGVFLVLMLGTLIGIMMAFLELTVDIYGNIKKENAKYKEEMKEEMKFFLKFKKNVKPVRKFEKENVEQESNDYTFNNINYLENYINENNQNA